MQVLLLLSCCRISLLSCFEEERRHFYKDRIKPWNVALNIICPLFFYIFLVCMLFAIWQEPWYAGKGMCLGRCASRTDCMAEQNIDMAWFDNAPGRWLNLGEFGGFGSSQAPECPGLCQCPWLKPLLNVTVLVPTSHTVSVNSRLCTAVVKVVNVLNGKAPDNGTAIPAVWYSITVGQNNTARLVGDKVVELTNSIGYATFRSPVRFDGRGGHGCNLTVLASDSFDLHAGSRLHNSVSWD
jgi:hypothetical protein